MKKLTAHNKENDRQIEMMVGKAMCAYANYKGATDNHTALVEQYGAISVEIVEAQYLSELEATERCIDMFVKEHLPEIGRYIIDRAGEEFGI